MILSLEGFGGELQDHRLDCKREGRKNKTETKRLTGEEATCFIISGPTVLVGSIISRHNRSAGPHRFPLSKPNTSPNSLVPTCDLIAVDELGLENASANRSRAEVNFNSHSSG